MTSILFGRLHVVPASLGNSNASKVKIVTPTQIGKKKKKIAENLTTQDPQVNCILQ